MRLTTLGTGAAAPAAARVQAGHLVEVGTVRLLLDCGSGVTHRLARHGIDWPAITHVAFTHFDADHVSDLGALLVAWRYGTLPPRTAPVTILGPPGIRAVVERLTEALGVRYAGYGFPVAIDEIAPGERRELGDGVAIAAAKVPHTPESVAYSIEGRGRRIVYTGDTGMDAALGEWARDCDVLLCECSLPREMAIPSHLTPEQCAELAALARPRHLALTHFYPPVEQVDIAAIVARRYEGPVTLAYDGWQLELEEH